MTPRATLKLEHALDGKTLVDRARSTLTPGSDEPFGADRAANLLATLRSGTDRLVIGDLIAEGGMGVVHSAMQVALERVVAVKRVRQGLDTKNERALVAEALITGALEHPNVIPVYDVDVDAAGAPVLIMKRIEGDSWSRLLSDTEAVRARAGTEPMVFHLKTLASVCDAIHFAHSRNVLHRDIKPDNVLLGHYGEVYVADWGIACAPGPCTRVIGTPAYMAPEMLLCTEVTARTDVYLLGGVLFEVVTGRLPHEGTTNEALASSILLGPPHIPPSVPPEIADLIRACMARDPADRLESARAVRQRIDALLEHRGSTALAMRADLLAAEIASALAQGAPRTAVYQTFTECRFAYREALRGWPENAHAKARLNDVLHRMLRHEIGRGDLGAARLLVNELTTVDRETRAAIENLERVEQVSAERMERLGRLEHELDPHVGRNARLMVGVGIGLLWTLLPFAGRFVGIHFGQLETLVAIPVTLLVVIAFALTGRIAGWRASQLNRRLSQAFGFVLVVEAIAAGVLYALHVPSYFVGRGVFFYWFVAIGIVATSIELRLLPAALGYLIGFAIVMRWPSTRYVCATILNLLFTVVMLLVWLRGTKKREASAVPSRSSAA